MPLRHVCIAACLGWLLLESTTLAAQPPLSNGPLVQQQTTTLKQKLEDGLKARLPEQFAFINRVVHLVDTHALPRSVVESTFLWAMHKPVRRFEYFEFGIRQRARALGISL